jgi:hypothetical protein
LIEVLGGGSEKETDTNLAEGRRKKVAHFWPDLLAGVKDYFFGQGFFEAK